MGASETGVAIFVWRKATVGVEVLLLHRGLFPSDYAGDWAWATPGGARAADEDPRSAAARELEEETGLALSLTPVDSAIAAAQANTRVHVFAAEAAGDAKITLSAEHDRYEWVSVEELARCRPAWVSEMYDEVLAHVNASRHLHGT